MPQMAPMWWTFIMLMTITFIMISIIMNYFNYNKFIKENSTINKSKMKWMW